MKYELAKKLKEAGFPQDKCSMLWKSQSVGTAFNPGNIACPTLSELIEACGDFLVKLERHGAGWGAFNADAPAAMGYNGKTPEEAVAELWLALHKK